LARFDLALDLDVLDSELSGYFRYNRDLFEPATIARLSDEFARLLADAVAAPDRRLLSFRLVGDWNAPKPAATGLRGYRARARQDPVPPTT
jgi:non-ribosomal peptide synthetase component F